MAFQQFFLAAAVAAQITGGAILGVVKDTTDSVIPGATVTATNVATNQSSVTQSNADGYYEFPLLPAGRYRVEIELEGFQKTRSAEFDLNSGVRQRFDMTLTTGQVSEAVDVVAQAPLVNATTTSLGVVMDQAKVEALPLNGRNFQQLVGLQAGVVNSPSSSTGGRGGIEFNGSPALGNNLMLDGVDMSFGESNGSASDTSAGASSGSLINTVSVEAIAEFKATGSAFSAEYGRATGGVLNVTTKSGTNRFHGTAFEFFRNDALDANSFFSNRSGLAKPPLRWNQFGGNFGGPIARDRIFFFVNYEGAQVRRAQTVTGNVPTQQLLNAVNPRIRAVLSQMPSTYEATSDPFIGFHRRNDERVNDEHTWLSRGDAQLSSGQRIAVRYNYNHQDYSEPTLLESSPRLFPTRGHNAVVQHSWVLSQRAFNELRFGVNSSNLDRHHIGTDDIPAFLSVSTGGLTGLALPSEIHFQTTTWSVNDNVTLVRGKHSMKAGFEVRVVNSERFQRGLPTHRYNNVAGLIADQPNDIQVIFGNPGRPLETTNYGVYVQDDWRLHDRLQLNAGLRYEYSPPLAGAFNVGSSDPFGAFQPAGEPMFDPDRNNFGPRLGLIYDTRGDQSLIVRAGGGVMYGPPQPLFYYDMAFIDPNVPFLSAFTPTDIPAGLSIAFPFPQVVRHRRRRRSVITSGRPQSRAQHRGLRSSRRVFRAVECVGAIHADAEDVGAGGLRGKPREQALFDAAGEPDRSGHERAAGVGHRRNPVPRERGPIEVRRAAVVVESAVVAIDDGRFVLHLRPQHRLLRARRDSHVGRERSGSEQHRRVAGAEGRRRAASLRQHAFV